MESTKLNVYSPTEVACDGGREAGREVAHVRRVLHQHQHAELLPLRGVGGTS
jgi:hypothetical protein